MTESNTGWTYGPGGWIKHEEQTNRIAAKLDDVIGKMETYDLSAIECPHCKGFRERWWICHECQQVVDMRERGEHDDAAYQQMQREMRQWRTDPPPKDGSTFIADIGPRTIMLFWSGNEKGEWRIPTECGSVSMVPIRVRSWLPIPPREEKICPEQQPESIQRLAARVTTLETDIHDAMCRRVREVEARVKALEDAPRQCSLPCTPVQTLPTQPLPVQTWPIQPPPPPYRHSNTTDPEPMLPIVPISTTAGTEGGK